jgi:hypothetical protein
MRASRRGRRGRGGVVDLAMRMGGVNALLGWETDTYTYTYTYTYPYPYTYTYTAKRYTFPYTRMRTGRDTRSWESEYE